MTMRFIPLAVAAVLALPLAAQSSLGSYDYVSPYTVRISSSDSDAGSRTFSDVANVYGPQVARLLATPANQLPTPVQKVPGKVLFSFLREWDCQPGIARNWTPFGATRGTGAGGASSCCAARSNLMRWVTPEALPCRLRTRPARAKSASIA